MEDKYHGKLKFNTKMTWVCIGVCPDQHELFKRNVNDNSYGTTDQGGCFLLNLNGFMYHDHFTEYCQPFFDQGVIVKMSLNMDKHAISYEINGKNHGIAYDKLMATGYRLAVTFNNPKQEIEFI